MLVIYVINPCVRVNMGNRQVFADIPKTAFRAGFSGLFEFTRMLFGLTNAGASFCRLMEMVIGDQQFVTLLFYLDDICIFANSANQMLD